MDGWSSLVVLGRQQYPAPPVRVLYTRLESMWAASVVAGASFDRRARHLALQLDDAAFAAKKIGHLLVQVDVAIDAMIET